MPFRLCCHASGADAARGAGVGLAPSGGGLPDAIGSPAAPRVRALALNTARLDDQQALKVVEQVGERLGIVCRDPIRHGADDLLQAMMSPETENMLKR